MSRFGLFLLLAFVILGGVGLVFAFFSLNSSAEAGNYSFNFIEFAKGAIITIIISMIVIFIAKKIKHNEQ